MTFVGYHNLVYPNIFLWVFSEVVDALNQLWKIFFSTIICISLIDNAAVAQAVALIKHSAYANEKLLPPRLQVTVA